MNILKLMVTFQLYKELRQLYLLFAEDLNQKTLYDYIDDLNNNTIKDLLTEIYVYMFLFKQISFFFNIYFAYVLHNIIKHLENKNN